jgi:hypothetical protein
MTFKEWRRARHFHTENRFYSYFKIGFWDGLSPEVGGGLFYFPLSLFFQKGGDLIQSRILAF